ncbi:phosphatase PAP2-related protein [Legionella impletisoli]|uniref:Sphingomyelin synthase-like domain-containing protein n=1 Tax=Legionella impletisoli TaxID=343510 RepID=A0A917JU78_9GAMM|nr:phosphatase PAP2-related protein [Legionella impletisoli]GGI82337.1 hypothetical protein GCM10007966_08610 [Legionella impletisoli]
MTRFIAVKKNINRSLTRRNLEGMVLLVMSFIIMNKAGAYTATVAGNSVPDLLLDYLPLFNVTTIHIYIAILFWVLFAIYLIIHPYYLSFFTKAAAIFILVRSGFICLTHLGVPTNHLTIPKDIARFVIYDCDLFFSGHVGGPFLIALTFWQNVTLRHLGLIAASFFAIIVLLGHIHYSIDVFAAPFITYGVFKFSQWLFPEDYRLLIHELTR